MNKNIEAQMNDRGYEKVTGVAIINDVAVTETSNQVLSPHLTTQEAVDLFNNESGDGWDLYRKVAVTH
jgi:hypothetical protein